VIPHKIAPWFDFLARPYSRPIESSTILELVANGMPTGKY
jgi:hypothetical protein